MLHCIHLLVADFAGVLFGSEHVQGVTEVFNLKTAARCSHKQLHERGESEPKQFPAEGSKQ